MILIGPSNLDIIGKKKVMKMMLSLDKLIPDLDMDMNI